MARSEMIIRKLECDQCGKSITYEYQVEIDIGWMHVNLEPLGIFVKKPIYKEGIDLCPECAEKFQQGIKKIMMKG